MKTKRLRIEEKVRIIKNNLKNKDVFTISDVEPLLNKKRSTLYWTLWNLVEKGYLSRVGKGLYSLYEKKEPVSPIISKTGKKVIKILEGSGYQFFISGLDILSVFMEHIPERFPVILFVERNSINEIVDLLIENGIDALPNVKEDIFSILRQLYSAKEIVLVYTTNEFKYSNKGRASIEKAFVDIYYEVTRKGYPLSLQELARIYLNMRRRIRLDTNRMTKIASRRSLHYDIRYIIENRQISEKAVEFVKIINSIENK